MTDSSRRDVLGCVSVRRLSSSDIHGTLKEQSEVQRMKIQTAQGFSHIDVNIGKLQPQDRFDDVSSVQIESERDLKSELESPKTKIKLQKEAQKANYYETQSPIGPKKPLDHTFGKDDTAAQKELISIAMKKLNQLET